ncbi:MAG TPA: hypothetical protein VJT33_00330 [bacterium]|nr:hypothetical protein [bacterium]
MAKPERFTDEDLRFVAETAGAGSAAEVPAHLRARPDLLDVMLEDDRLVDRLLGDEQVLLRVSPRLVFSVLLRRVVRDLQQKPYTVERNADETIAVFDATQVRRFVAEPAIWQYLVSMLTSFVRNESVTVLVRRRGHYVRRRFNTSSLEDMIDLSGLADTLSPPLAGDAVPWIFRRIGDIALFQSGIFPRSLGWAVRPGRERAVPRTLASYEEHGRRFYRLAATRTRALAGQQDGDLSVPAPDRRGVEPAVRRSADEDPGRVLEALAEEFAAARKSLELLADRYLRWSTIRLFPGFD